MVKWGKSSLNEFNPILLFGDTGLHFVMKQYITLTDNSIEAVIYPFQLPTVSVIACVIGTWIQESTKAKHLLVSDKESQMTLQ